MNNMLDEDSYDTLIEKVKELYEAPEYPWSTCDICGSGIEAGNYCDDCLKMLQDPYTIKELQRINRGWRLKNR